MKFEGKNISERAALDFQDFQAKIIFSSDKEKKNRMCNRGRRFFFNEEFSFQNNENINPKYCIAKHHLLLNI